MCPDKGTHGDIEGPGQFAPRPSCVVLPHEAQSCASADKAPEVSANTRQTSVGDAPQTYADVQEDTPPSGAMPQVKPPTANVTSR